jgi:hypothetical protein
MTRPKGNGALLAAIVVLLAAHLVIQLPTGQEAAAEPDPVGSPVCCIGADCVNLFEPQCVAMGGIYLGFILDGCDQINCAVKFPFVVSVDPMGQSLCVVGEAHVGEGDPVRHLRRRRDR